MGLSSIAVTVIHWVLSGKLLGVEPVVGLLSVCFALKLSRGYALNVEKKLLSHLRQKGRCLIKGILYRWV